MYAADGDLLEGELENSKSEIVFAPLPEDDPTQRRPAISLAVEELGWRPRVALREGLERTAVWFARLGGAGYEAAPP